jgi:hypothetical protein
MAQSQQGLIPLFSGFRPGVLPAHVADVSQAHLPESLTRARCGLFLGGKARTPSGGQVINLRSRPYPRDIAVLPAGSAQRSPLVPN